MNPKEHLLMVGVLAKQLQLIKALVTVLESRGILEGDDLSAFHALVRSDSKVTDDLIDEAERMYQSLAKPLGLEVALDL